MDIVHSTLKWLDHNRYTALGLVMTALLFTYLAACESKTESILSPGKAVTRSGFEAEAARQEASLVAEQARLQAEIAAFNARAKAHNTLVEAGRADLDRKDEFKMGLIDAVGGQIVQAVTTGTFNPASLISTLLTGGGIGGLLLAGGTKLDNKRKDSKIKQLSTTAA